MAPMMQPPFFECDPAPGCKLILSGIHWDYHTVESLRLYFEKFGSLDQIEGNPRGAGFVIFEDKDSADKCLAQNKGVHFINDRKVEVRVSRYKDGSKDQGVAEAHNEHLLASTKATGATF